MSINVFAGEPDLSEPNEPLAGVEDFVEWLAITSPSAAETARIHTALEIASAQIRNRRRIFSPISNETVIVDGSGAQSLLLPSNRLPVTAIQQVEELVGADWVAVDASAYDWSPDGIVMRIGYWSSRVQAIRVTYSHGYAILPRDVAGVCLAAAKRLYDQPASASGVQSEQLGDHHVTFFANAGGLLPDEAELLVAYESRMA